MKIKSEKTRLIVWALIALVVGVVIGMIITNATTGNATVIVQSKTTVQSNLLKDVSSQYCGENFSVSNINNDYYECHPKPNYPINACTPSLINSNLYMSVSGPAYQCYFTENLETLRDCPLLNESVYCLDGFVPSYYDYLLLSECRYGCIVNPNPKDLNPEFPCVKNGYYLIGGGGHGNGEIPYVICGYKLNGLNMDK